MEETRLLTRAVHEFARRTRFPVAFGGMRDDTGTTRVTSFIGTRTSALEGLAVAPDRGLGGRAVMEVRPRMTGDYASARQITHDYDTYVLGEGLGTLLAVPIVVNGTPRGILYGGSWGAWSVGGVTAEPAVAVAERLGRELGEHEAARQRLEAETAPVADAAPTPSLSSSQREELRETYTELRRISATLNDDALRERLQSVERRLASLSGTELPEPPPTSVHLSRRETDVLACAALGSTNQQIAEQLDLRTGTVKAYLGAAMSKLDASTRHAAVATARKYGLLP